MATLEQTTRVMMYLSALWPREPVTEPTIKAYHTILKDLDGEALTAAAEKVAADATFFPKAAELRKAAFDLIQGDELPTATEGWRQLTKGSEELHELTRKALDVMGGRNAYRQLLIKDVSYFRASFIKTFEAYRNREMEDRRQLPAVAKYKELQAGKVSDEIKKLAGKLGDTQW